MSEVAETRAGEEARGDLVSPGEPPALEAEEILKTFSSGEDTLTILNGLSLRLEKGRSVAILGASGSGKSTLMYLLGGLDRPTGGRILSKGQDVFSLSQAQRARWRSK